MLYPEYGMKLFARVFDRNKGDMVLIESELD
jgi:preprotein translocase subunit YajC